MTSLTRSLTRRSDTFDGAKALSFFLAIFLFLCYNVCKIKQREKETIAMTYDELVKIAYDEIMGFEKDASASDYLINKPSVSFSGSGTASVNYGKNLIGEVGSRFGKEQRLMNTARNTAGGLSSAAEKSIRKHVWTKDRSMSSELKNRVANLKRDGMNLKSISNDLRSDVRSKRVFENPAEKMRFDNVAGKRLPSIGQKLSDYVK